MARRQIRHITDLQLGMQSGLEYEHDKAVPKTKKVLIKADNNYRV